MVTALVYAARTLQTQYTYEPFGYVSQTGQANGNSYKFTGREDDGTGLYYYRARYYQPRLQRFVSEDPLGFAGGLNPYRYARNNPLRFNDPLGLKEKDELADVTEQVLCLLIPFCEANVPSEFVPIIPGIVESNGWTGGWPGWDGSKTPGQGWEWKGSGPPGSSQGSWYNPSTKESLHPDLNQGPPHGPHWDHSQPGKPPSRIRPDGTIVPKR